MPDSENYLLKNDTLGSIKNRRSIRQFTDDPVSGNDLKTILHAANQAPSAHNPAVMALCRLKRQKEIRARSSRNRKGC